jgi:hypothetical protein
MGLSSRRWPWRTSTASAALGTAESEDAGDEEDNMNRSIDSTTIQPALDIRRDAIYRPVDVICALGLRKSSLRTEWLRAG